MKTVYKVVSNRDGKLYSAIIGNCVLINHICSIEYIPNQWVISPRNTRIFCFEKFDDAKKFRDSEQFLNSLQIWKCGTFGGIKYYPALLNSYSNMKDYWNCFNKNIKNMKRNKFKNIRVNLESLLVKKLMLLEKV